MGWISITVVQMPVFHRYNFHIQNNYTCTLQVIHSFMCSLQMIECSFLSLHVSSVNLMTCMGSLTTIVKQRPVYMKSVVQGFESLNGLFFLY